MLSGLIDELNEGLNQYGSLQSTSLNNHSLKRLMEQSEAKDINRQETPRHREKVQEHLLEALSSLERKETAVILGVGRDVGNYIEQLANEFSTILVVDYNHFDIDEIDSKIRRLGLEDKVISATLDITFLNNNLYSCLHEAWASSKTLDELLDKLLVSLRKFKRVRHTFLKTKVDFILSTLIVSQLHGFIYSSIYESYIPEARQHKPSKNPAKVDRSLNALSSMLYDKFVPMYQEGHTELIDALMAPSGRCLLTDTVNLKNEELIYTDGDLKKLTKRTQLGTMSEREWPYVKVNPFGGEKESGKVQSLILGKSG